MVGDLRRNLADVPHPLAFAALDAQAIPLADASAEVIIANHMLYHIPDLPRALAEIRRVLKPEGTLYASTNGARHMHQLYELVRAFGGEPSDEHQVIRTFNLDNGAAILSRYFTRVEMRPRKNLLKVTDVEPLVEYVRSNWDMDKRYIDANVDGFRAFVGGKMRDGSFLIDTDSGMLVASGRPNLTPGPAPQAEREESGRGNNSW
jgi:SAM-dependent methyltransferase